MQQSCPISCRHMLRSEPVAIYRFPAPIPSEVQSSFSEIFGYLIASDRVLKLFVIPLSSEPITLSLNSSIWLIWILDAREGLVQALNRPARPPTGLIRPPRPVRRARGAQQKKSHGVHDGDVRARRASQSELERTASRSDRTRGMLREKLHVTGKTDTGYHQSVTKTLS